MGDRVISRIAPTPSGFLHRGNAYNFLLTDRLIQQQNGLLRLRIDDLDAPRMRSAYLEDIFITLDWLGISWTEGPTSAAEHRDRFSQQMRISRYQQTLDQLAASGRVFACSCSRKEIVSISADGQYPGTCIYKKLPLDMPGTSWRLRTDPGTIICLADPISGTQTIDLYRKNRHFIVRRKDGFPAYHVASLTDDVDYGINLIVRGNDLLESTATQLLLAKFLNLTTFEQTQFYHHPLIYTDDGTKLSKSAGSTSIRSMIGTGMSASAFYLEFEEWLMKSPAGISGFRQSRLL